MKRGSFLYDGTVRCRVEIVQTDFLPSTDEDAPDIHGTFYEIHYWAAGAIKGPSSMVYGFKTIEEAVRHVESAVNGVQWENNSN